MFESCANTAFEIIRSMDETISRQKHKHKEHTGQKETIRPTQNTTKKHEGMISRTSLTRMPSKGQPGQRCRDITWAILEIMWSMVFVKSLTRLGHEPGPHCHMAEMISRTYLTRMPSKGQPGHRFSDIIWASLDIVWSMVFVESLTRLGH